MIGFDGVFLDQISEPKLTTIKQDVYKMGETCAAVLLEKINHPDKEIENIAFSPQLVIRNSTRVINK